MYTKASFSAIFLVLLIVVIATTQVTEATAVDESTSTSSPKPIPVARMKREDSGAETGETSEKPVGSRLKRGVSPKNDKI